MRSLQHPEAVAAHVECSILRARPEEPVHGVLARFAAERPACAELVLVVGAEGRLEGAVPLSRLVRSPADEPVGALMEPDWPRVTPGSDQEKAASLALHRRVDVLAVVDEHGTALGAMPSQALLQVLRQEHVEDLHRLAGIERESAQARHAIEDPPMRRARHRLPWLLVGLAGSALATAAMAAMEARLQANVAIAFFIPALVYLADAVGTQTETIAVRGLSLTRGGSTATLPRLLAGELRTGLLIGLVLGALTLPAVWLAFGDARLATAVALSILVAGALANSIGLLFPWMLMRLRMDPAYGSGPVATVVQDTLTILVYFAILWTLGL